MVGSALMISVRSHYTYSHFFAGLADFLVAARSGRELAAVTLVVRGAVLSATTSSRFLFAILQSCGKKSHLNYFNVVLMVRKWCGVVRKVGRASLRCFAARL